jgi:hypothetical protein
MDSNKTVVPDLTNDDQKRYALESAEALLSKMENPEERHKLMAYLPRKLAFALDPEHYAEKAMEIISLQLKTVRSPHRKRKLEFRYQTWKNLLDDLRA